MWANVCQVSKICNKSRKTKWKGFQFLACDGNLCKCLEVSHVKTLGLWKRCVMCTLYTFILCISLFHHLPTKTLAVLDSPCNDVTIKQMIAIWLQAMLGILGKTGYKEHARRKRHLLLLLQCSLFWLWGEEQDLVWSFEQVNNWDLLSFIGRLSWSRRKNNP